MMNQHRLDQKTQQNRNFIYSDIRYPSQIYCGKN